MSLSVSEYEEALLSDESELSLSGESLIGSGFFSRSAMYLLIRSSVASSSLSELKTIFFGGSLAND
jgi:hypothetical protein